MRSDIQQFLPSVFVLFIIPCLKARGLHRKVVLKNRTITSQMPPKLKQMMEGTALTILMTALWNRSITCGQCHLLLLYILQFFC